MKRKVIVALWCLVFLSGCAHTDEPSASIPVHTNEMPEIHEENENSTEISGISTPEDESSEEKYLPVKRTAAISADKPKFTFVQKLVEPFATHGDVYYGSAVIEVYESGITDKPIDSISIEQIFPIAWGEYSVIDINFDGYKDVVAVTSRQGNQGMSIYACFTWNEELKKFEVASLPSWGFVSVDVERQLLLASWRNWAGGHGWAIYEYIDGALIETHECYRDYLGTINGNGTEMIHFHEEQLIDGEMQVVFDGDVTEDELDAHLLYDDLWQLSSESWIGVWEVSESEDN